MAAVWTLLLRRNRSVSSSVRLTPCGDHSISWGGRFRQDSMTHGMIARSQALLFYLPPYSPQLNLIEIVWKHFKYHWRRFVTWTK